MEKVTIFGIPYSHLRLPSGDDLYYTRHGKRWAKHLVPENFWKDRTWFKANSTKLFGHKWHHGGTGSVYRVRTKEVAGEHLNIVLKWNRMGQDVPGAKGNEELMAVSFNSPYEEFALLEELRNARDDGKPRLLTQRPLAIYVPARRMESWQTGRDRHKIKTKIRTHSDIELDMHRSYAVIYEWVEGLDAPEAVKRGIITEEEMKALALRAREDLKSKGFVIHDHKPQHVIVRPKNNETEVLHDQHGNIPYVLVDFELLERTPEREAMTRHKKRMEYHRRQSHRFDEYREPMPSHLQRVTIMGVDYVYGHAPSTNGDLWVVGHDPGLFDYFLPDKWERSERTKLSLIHEVYHTLTKDDIQLVWRLSRVGQRPFVDPFQPEQKKILEYGYNSPFEEFSMCLDLNRKGIKTIYPRAIYMTGHRVNFAETLKEQSRYLSHAHLTTPLKTPLLRDDRAYYVIWGYYNKPDDMLAEADAGYYRSIDALQAYREQILTEEEYIELMQRITNRLGQTNMEDLNLRGNHMTLTLDNDGNLVRQENGEVLCLMSNFELMRRLD